VVSDQVSGLRYIAAGRLTRRRRVLARGGPRRVGSRRRQRGDSEQQRPYFCKGTIRLHLFAQKYHKHFSS
jgi:hypothetical protein